MISISEQKEIFTNINTKLQQKTADLINRLSKAGLKLTKHEPGDIESKHFSKDYVYYLAGGNVALESDDKELLLFEEGDIITPHCRKEYEQANINFVVRAGLKLVTFSLEELFKIMAKDERLIALWFSITTLNQLQLHQVIAATTQKEHRANPGFKRFNAGDVIIQEGDAPNYVYSITSGSAAAFHNEVEVGEIKQDEIFGAIAVLTNQKRSASVIAKTDCMVLMVHKDEFSKMVHSHPDLFLNILKDLANTIKSLNEKVSQQNSQ